MSLLVGTKNIATQDVAALGIISLGSTYRRYCKKNSCGVRTFDVNSTSITLQQQGIYHITATLVGSGDTAGVITVQLLENGVAVPGAFSSETITTADTELRTFVIDYYVLVDDVCLLGTNSTSATTISLQNTGIAATFTSVIVNIEKAV
jgi:hypothetical protein